MPVSPSAISIDLTRDDSLNDFTLQTLKDRYLFGGETSPQEAFARASAAFADDEAHAQRLYDYVSKGWFMFATPLLSNGGLKRGLPISCFLTMAEDSLSSISDHYDEIMWLSSQGGGIGGYWNLRSDGEKTSKGSKSTGQMPFQAVIDRLILAVSQGGTRRGSYAAYVDIHHPEIFEFITSRKPTGGDQNRKITNLHNAVNITDEFMEAVKHDREFGLRSPKTGEVIRTVQARDLWRLLIETRMQTGEPYLHFVDTSNRAMPESQKAKGLRVNQSNLCVTPDTQLLTRDGYKPIGALFGREVEVWNGQEWSLVTVTKTGEDQALVRVWMEDGSFIDCTPYHKFYDHAGVEHRAGALKRGTILEQVAHPVVAPANPKDFSLDTAYVAGFATIRGYEDKNRLSVFVPDAFGQPIIKRLMGPSVDANADVLGEGFYVRYEPRSIPTGVVPRRWTGSARMAWLGGALDAGAEWVQVDREWFLSIALNDATVVQEMRLAALEAGLQPRIRITDTGSGFMLNAKDAHILIKSGVLLRHRTKYVEITIRGESLNVSTEAAPVVADVQPLPWPSDTFCVTEPKRNRVVFNGILTGNCTEIMLPTGRDHMDKMRTAVCCLSSVNAETYDEWKDHPTFIEDMMRMLDNTLQHFIDNAPPEMANAVYSATQERAVGLGLLGFRAYLQRHDVIMESRRARQINIELFTHLRRQADAASLKLGAERGEAPDMAGTGERFSHKLAVAPNASSSIIIPTPNGSGTSASIEPDRANAYLHKTLSGSFPVKNPYLKKKLASLDRDTEETWKSIIGAEGSVQHLDFLDEHTKAVFRTAIEINQRALIRLNADRTPLVCQGVSLNLFYPHDVDAKTLTEDHFLIWQWGNKSAYYLRSTTPKRAENTNAQIERKYVGEDAAPTMPSAGISANASEDSACVACEG